jgi:serine protease Do
VMDPNAWAEAKRGLTEARALLKDYDANPLLKESFYRSDAARVLAQRAEQLEGAWRDAAAKAFPAYDHFSGRSFFDAYPAKLDGKAVMAAGFLELEPQLAAASPEQLLAFAKSYPNGEALAEEQFEKLNRRYVDAYLKAQSGSGKPGLAQLVSLAGALKGGPFKAMPAEVARFAFVDATSRTLLDRGAIEFPPQVEVDLPFEARAAELDAALSDPTLQSADYLIVFDVALAKTERRVRDRRESESRFVAGKRRVPNPAYEMARVDWMSAQSALNAAQIEKSVNSVNANNMASTSIFGAFAGLAMTIADIARVEEAKKVVEAAHTKLQSTPQLIDEPVYQDYAYDRVTVDARKLLTVNFYVVDRAARRLYKDTFDVVEQEKFDVAYRVHKDDPDRASILRAAASEDDVDKWEKKPVSVKLSALVDQYLKNAAAARPLPPLEAMRKEMLADKNLALAKFESTKFEQRADARFDSVVAVYNPQGALGSGFFVRPDVVLTNYHVISGAKFVEMRTYDKQETFGKVIDSDPRLDLALVKVQSRGKPVEFYEGKSLDLGATVEAIGHPRGAMFSITRGVVSAVRESATTYQMGGKPVLFVQTDAPISPGNSGGPLFMGAKVVGVNTQTRRDSQNLNLSVHYSEVLEFLRRSEAMN